MLEMPGIPKGHITLVRGHSNTGKTTLLIEAAIEAQKTGVLPIIIITEMKHSWEHWSAMGFDLGETIDESGNKDYKGFFIYADRESLQCIEDNKRKVIYLMIYYFFGIQLDQFHVK